MAAAVKLKLNQRTNELEEGRLNDRTISAKRAYGPPQLVEFGDVRDVVLGISPGIGDSGAPTLFKP